MIPVLEIQGYLAICLTVIIVMARIYYCNKLYNAKFIMEILIMAILTSILWIAYCMYKSHHGLLCQFVISLVLYVSVLMYMMCMKKQ